MPDTPIDARLLAASSLPVQDLIERIYSKYRSCADGKVADYIPELAKVDPDQFGIALATADGFVYEIGDAGAPFTLQSISKPIVYGLALEDHGRDAVLAKIGVEPSGDAFNSIEFDEKHNRPFNPMVNAGAIAATALVSGLGAQQRFDRIRAIFKRFAGREITLDDAVYRSEMATGHRNRAIAYLELNSGMITEDVDEHLDLYFRQCSLGVTARDLAIMGATLANDGINPLTGQRALAREHVRNVLSVMNTCGMYDYAGEWQFDVGLPAKSGVGGGIMAVLPGQLGIGVFSPRLDAVGNSFRGVKVCEDLSKLLKLHLLDHRGNTRTPIRRSYRASEVRSKRVRRAANAARLDHYGKQILVYELQGDLSFATTEHVTRLVLGDINEASHFILDGERLASVDSVAQQLLSALAKSVAEAGKHLFVVVRHDLNDGSGISPASLDRLGTIFHDLDTALELCEDQVLAGAENNAGERTSPMVLEELDFCQGFDTTDLDDLRNCLVAARYRKGDHVIKEGEMSDKIFLLAAGRVDICVRLAPGEDTHRVSTVEAGNIFGELGIFAAGPRTADAIAATDVDCYILGAADVQAFFSTNPLLYRKLMTSVGKNLADRLRRANTEIRALAR